MKFNIDVKVILQEWLVQLINIKCFNWVHGSIFVQTRLLCYAYATGQYAGD